MEKTKRLQTVIRSAECTIIGIMLPQNVGYRLWTVAH